MTQVLNWVFIYRYILYFCNIIIFIHWINLVPVSNLLRYIWYRLILYLIICLNCRVIWLSDYTCIVLDIIVTYSLSFENSILLYDPYRIILNSQSTTIYSALWVSHIWLDCIFTLWITLITCGLLPKQRLRLILLTIVILV